MFLDSNVSYFLFIILLYLYYFYRLALSCNNEYRSIVDEMSNAIRIEESQMLIFVEGKLVRSPYLFEYLYVLRDSFSIIKKKRKKKKIARQEITKNRVASNCRLKSPSLPRFARIEKRR